MLNKWHSALVATLVAVATGSIAAESIAAGTSGGSSDIKIGYAVPVLANPYWETNVQFAKQMASALGVSLIVESANDQADTQLQNVENLAAQGVKGIVFGPIDTRIGPAILKVCQQHNIVCAAAERRPGVEPNDSNKGYFAGYVVGDDRDLGARIGQILDRVGARKCVAMSGIQGNSVADLRLQGFTTYAESHGMAVLSTFRPAELAADGQKATENVLAQLPGPKFDCAFGFDGDVGTGAISALSKAGVLNKVKVATIGPTSSNIGELKSGQMLASIGGEFMDGGFATIMVYDAMRGHRATSGAVVLHGVTVLRSNVARYAAQFGGNPVTGYDAKQLSATYNPRATTAGFMVKLK